ncbi:efflux RND transporter periplasmic adaptor subunit [Oleiagrimonas sp. C23AA]|uniref:efflux RND transporter periplasmic adaptor subunit n=1 Tax=Oleiagrimonas sp. C23AA TaxID=2719047 RepID=UPI001423EC4D|nr:efflux RND transporter periplasmic adaptor subunit [Oleiagrimonas sp. C23AA]NII11110.1 efflux RND transporter periplasmic adaptor subunit [Oleiagrimonas sp. C23AA]
MTCARLPLRLCLLALALATPIAHAASASVKTAQILPRTLHDQVEVYGQVIPDPAYTRTISALEAGRVAQVNASMGEHVEKGSLLLKLAPTPKTHTAWLKARHAVDSAHAKWLQTRDLFKRKLATKADLAAALQQYRNAKSDLQALKDQGATQGPLSITAKQASIVTQIQAQPGAVVQMGQPLVTLSDTSHVRVRLGLQPEQAQRVHAGQSVTLTPVFGDGSTPVQAKVSRVQGMVDPRTRLIDVLVDLSGRPAHQLLMGSWLKGQLQVQTLHHLSVPHSAVLNGAHGPYLFVVRNGKAHRINVKVLLTTPRWSAVQSPDLRKGQNVVVTGNYELTEGMTVRMAGGRH